MICDGGTLRATERIRMLSSYPINPMDIAACTPGLLVASLAPTQSMELQRPYVSSHEQIVLGLLCPCLRVVCLLYIWNLQDINCGFGSRESRHMLLIYLESCSATFLLPGMPRTDREASVDFSAAPFTAENWIE